MLYDAQARRIQVSDRLESLERDFAHVAQPVEGSPLRRVRGRLAGALRLPFAAAEFEAAQRTLPRAMAPVHCRSTTPTSFGRHVH